VNDLNYYQRIQVKPSASPAAINERINDLLGIYSEQPEELSNFLKIRKVLLDPVERTRYDDFIGLRLEPVAVSQDFKKTSKDHWFVKNIKLVSTYTPVEFVFTWTCFYCVLAFFNTFLVFHKGDFDLFEFAVITWVSLEWTLSAHVSNKLAKVNAPEKFYPRLGSIWLSSSLCFGACVGYYMLTQNPFPVLAGLPAMWVSVSTLWRLFVEGDYERSYNASRGEF
jgi:hypothetical protein